MLREHASTIAAICIEPIVQGAAGMIVHPPGFLREVRRLATQYNVLLICDEVAVGFGRTGRMFACEHEDVQPDLMCVAKGITGGYLPLAATFATQAIFDAFLGEPWEGKTFYHGHTYTGNPLACAAAIASLDLFEANDVLTNVRNNADTVRDFDLDAAPFVGDVRFKGTMIGIELALNKETRQSFDPRRRIGAEFCMLLRKRGVILRPLGDVIVIMPPLAIPNAVFRELFTAVRAELDEMKSWI
jgi:adenosylmethionine-8-amino-7-oxononanoate aminotransferase